MAEKPPSSSPQMVAHIDAPLGQLRLLGRLKLENVSDAAEIFLRANHPELRATIDQLNAAPVATSPEAFEQYCSILGSECDGSIEVAPLSDEPEQIIASVRGAVGDLFHSPNGQLRIVASKEGIDLLLGHHLPLLNALPIVSTALREGTLRDISGSSIESLSTYEERQQLAALLDSQAGGARVIPHCDFDEPVGKDDKNEVAGGK